LQDSGTETTNLHSHLKNNSRAQFQALQQAVRAKGNNASMRQVTIMILLLSRQFDHYWSW